MAASHHVPAWSAAQLTRVPRRMRITVQPLHPCCSVRTGRDDLFEAGTQFWYVLMASRNFSGLYCMGIHTSKADCYNPAMTIGSAADSTYEYMLKQWVMSNHTQGVSMPWSRAVAAPVSPARADTVQLCGSG